MVVAKAQCSCKEIGLAYDNPRSNVILSASDNNADIDDIENEQMARNLKPKKKRGRGM